MEASVTHRLILGLSLTILACGGGGRESSPGTVATTSSPQESVRGFFQAVADSDVTGMTHLWGTARGPSAVTGQPHDYQKRMVVAQLFLRGAPFKILGEEAVDGAADRRLVQVQLNRGQCVKNLPVLTVRMASGQWLVTQIDLNLAGHPGRPCTSESRSEN